MAQGIQPTSNVSKSVKLVTSNKKRKQSAQASQDHHAIPAVRVSTAKETATTTAAKHKRRRKSAPTQPSSSTTTAVPVPVAATNTASRRRRSSTTALGSAEDNGDNTYSTSPVALGAEEDADVVASPNIDYTHNDTFVTASGGVGDVYNLPTITTEDADDGQQDEEEVGMMFDYETIFDNGMLE